MRSLPSSTPRACQVDASARERTAAADVSPQVRRSSALSYHDDSISTPPDVSPCRCALVTGSPPPDSAPKPWFLPTPLRGPCQPAWTAARLALEPYRTLLSASASRSSFRCTQANIFHSARQSDASQKRPTCHPHAPTTCYWLQPAEGGYAKLASCSSAAVPPILSEAAFARVAVSISPAIGTHSVHTGHAGLFSPRQCLQRRRARQC